MIQLETFKGTKSRHTCPACNSKGVFVRYKDERGEYISFDVGRCNRESKCGYHRTPKEHFADNPTFRKSVKTHAGKSEEIKMRNPRFGYANADSAFASFDYIAPEHLKATLNNYERNAFVQFLFDLFPDCAEEIQAVLKMYFVGTYQGYTSFPSIDRLNRVCRAKLIRFNPATGKRFKGQFDTSSLVRKLKLKEEFQYKQIFFGEHLLSKFPNKPVAIVEAEKTAIVASLCFPEFVWLACNSKTWLKAERIKRLGNRQIILYPDADGFDLWQGIASEARTQGLNVKVSALIENHATDEQKEGGFDLADYLINQQTEINQFNNFVDRYNAKLETVLNDEKLGQDFETILDERISTIEIDGNLSRIEVETIATAPENIRRIVLNL